MRIEIPQIFWHGNRDRIMSIDFYPNSNFLVTSGAESENRMYVKLWRIEQINIDTITPNLQNNNNNSNSEENNQNNNSNQNNNLKKKINIPKNK